MGCEATLLFEGPSALIAACGSGYRVGLSKVCKTQARPPPRYKPWLWHASSALRTNAVPGTHRFSHKRYLSDQNDLVLWPQPTRLVL